VQVVESNRNGSSLIVSSIHRDLIMLDNLSPILLFLYSFLRLFQDMGVLHAVRAEACISLSRLDSNSIRMFSLCSIHMVVSQSAVTNSLCGIRDGWFRHGNNVSEFARNENENSENQYYCSPIVVDPHRESYPRNNVTILVVHQERFRKLCPRKPMQFGAINGFPKYNGANIAGTIMLSFSAITWS